MTKYITELMEKLESYGFECEAGPLTDCVDWQKIKDFIAGKGVGMYGETPRVQVGEFSICRQDNKGVWIDLPCGEGGAFPDELLEPVIAKFYGENF